MDFLDLAKTLTFFEISLTSSETLFTICRISFQSFLWLHLLILRSSPLILLVTIQWFLMGMDRNYWEIDGNCKEIDLIQDSHTP